MQTRWTFFIITLLMLTFITAPVHDAAAQGEPIYGIISTDNAEVRAGPDFAYPVIGQLPINASVNVVGRAGQFVYSWNGRQWIQIQYGDRNAWVYARLMRTSLRFNRIPVTGMLLPRNNNGRVPDVFDLSTYICDRWQGDFVRVGDFMAGDTELNFTFPALTGTTVYSLIVIVPDTEFRIPFDTDDNQVTVPLNELPARAGTYTWRIVPYWSNTTNRNGWQQICPLRTGGTFDKPLTDSSVRDRYD